mmetsp:Transcript_22622/g.39964  ORF Transcript_22622/g.39964 Transcript_22622/m.39964 type:complete len:99 (+) Transcript_22622:107-403(+)
MSSTCLQSQQSSKYVLLICLAADLPQPVNDTHAIPIDPLNGILPGFDDVFISAHCIKHIKDLQELRFCTIHTQLEFFLVLYIRICLSFINQWLEIFLT